MEKGDVARRLHHFCVAEVFSDHIDVRVFGKTPDSSSMNKIDEFSVAFTSTVY